MTTFYTRSTEIAGTNYRQRDVDAFLTTPADYTLDLRAEPTNRFDRNAIQVIAVAEPSREHLLGYVPAHLAKRIAEEGINVLTDLDVKFFHGDASKKIPLITIDIIDLREQL